jgi:hypothetical protein
LEFVFLICTESCFFITGKKENNIKRVISFIIREAGCITIQFSVEGYAKRKCFETLCQQRMDIPLFMLRVV